MYVIHEVEFFLLMQDVINIDNYSIIKEFSQYLVHHSLKGSGGVDQTKRHSLVLI